MTFLLKHSYQATGFSKKVYNACSFGCCTSCRLWEQLKAWSWIFWKEKIGMALWKNPDFILFLFAAILCYLIVLLALSSSAMEFLLWPLACITPAAHVILAGEEVGGSYQFLQGKLCFSFRVLGRNFPHHQAILPQWNRKILLEDHYI